MEIFVFLMKHFFNTLAFIFDEETMFSVGRSYDKHKDDDCHSNEPYFSGN